DTPGLDVESVTGMVGGGAQAVLFTTGLGTPTGNPIAPVIKITGNARTARSMADNIDVDVSGIMMEVESLDAAADRPLEELIGILKTTLQGQFGWNEIDYSDIVFSFQLAYAIGFVFAGRLMDRVGTKTGFSLALIIWSLAAIAHAGATVFGPSVAALLAFAGLHYSASVAGFIAARFALGLGESGNFPGAIKTVAEWFPRRERAFATGLFNAGTNVGALVTPLTVPWITVRFGWPWAFVITGALGFAWLAAWWLMYDRPERHARLSAAELAHIRSNPAEPQLHIPWIRLIPLRQTWTF